MRHTFVRAHERALPAVLGRGRREGFSFSGAASASLDAAERRAVDHAAARDRLRAAASEHGAELAGRLDAFAAGADPTTVEELTAHLAAGADRTEGGRDGSE